MTHSQCKRSSVQSYNNNNKSCLWRKWLNSHKVTLWSDDVCKGSNRALAGLGLGKEVYLCFGTVRNNWQGVSAPWKQKSTLNIGLKCIVMRVTETVMGIILLVKCYMTALQPKVRHDCNGVTVVMRYSQHWLQIHQLLMLWMRPQCDIVIQRCLRRWISY